ncbi:hypothetical protein WJX84_012448 [Apatococcus fuscideae]|uniref:Uncharacterized protein n=1 Tax=Apatococcus fuscideae TaxID=2026836 RepID=A0AAW1T0R4_9CHLO
MASHRREWSVRWDIEATLDFICSQAAQRVTLQFPDDLLDESSTVAASIQQGCRERGRPEVQVYVLADTTFNSMSVDEVAAQHINANCIVHYGRASLAPVTSLPAYFVFGQAPVELEATVGSLGRALQEAEEGGRATGKKAVVVLPDQHYLWAVPSLQKLLGPMEHQGSSSLRMIFAEAPTKVRLPAKPPSRPAPVAAAVPPRSSSAPGANAAEPRPAAACASKSCCGSLEPLPPTSEAASSISALQLQDSGQSSQAASSAAASTMPSTPGTAQPERTEHALHPQPAASAEHLLEQGQPSTHAAAPHALPTQARPQHEPSGGCCSSTADDPIRNGSKSDKSSAASGRCNLVQQDRAASGGKERRWQHVGGGLAWDLPPGVVMDDCMLLWLGNDTAPQLQHLHLTYNRSEWMQLDPATQRLTHDMPSTTSKLLRRRYFLTEKAKDANIIGIVVGTLGDRGYLQAARHVRALAEAAGKKTYTLLMGRPSPAKLANFPEVEVFVMVADAPGLVLDDSRDYFAPVITPWEALLAFDDDLEWTGEYKLGFQCLLDHASERPGQQGSSVAAAHQLPRQSLLDGGLHGNHPTADDGGSSALARRIDRSLQISGQGGKQLTEVRSAADFMVTRRTYTGLEAPMTGAAEKPVEKAVLGRSGRAAGYQQEPRQHTPDMT